MIYFILAYLTLNCIFAIVTKEVIERADVYWKRGEEAPTNLMTLTMMITVIIISRTVAKGMGYCVGIYNILTNRYVKSEDPSKTVKIIRDTIIGIIEILFYIPLFVYSYVSEVCFRIIHKNDED